MVNKLHGAAATELRLLESAELLGEEYPGEDISLRRGDNGFRVREVSSGKMTRC